MKLTYIGTPATQSVAFPCDVPVTGIRRAAPIAMTAALGLTVHGEAKLRQEKTAFTQAQMRKAAAAVGTRTTVPVSDRSAMLGRLFGDAKIPTTGTSNAGVQGPPPWRPPVIT
ncbi:hypothetical protein [Sphaerisporangium sp. TRM90804]|uniref:hypothetical protein n=1 Tax=Sphaerisporangium sp. TRM90804 TaxID=3031113 RepID=UPI00244A2820|nr:hypothetical protein [Sphaerisporangium sp. TRM90804]MDH2429806.1 hypothetical protein [Sphaerisporangium sp. TRM90804]